MRSAKSSGEIGESSEGAGAAGFGELVEAEAASAGAGVVAVAAEAEEEELSATAITDEGANAETSDVERGGTARSASF